MGTRVRVEYPRAVDGPALRDALAASGLVAELVREGEGETCGIEVGYRIDEHDRLFADVTHAIEGWLAEQGLPLVPVRGVDGECLVRPPAG